MRGAVQDLCGGRKLPLEQAGPGASGLHFSHRTPARGRIPGHLRPALCGPPHRATKASTRPVPPRTVFRLSWRIPSPYRLRCVWLLCLPKVGPRREAKTLPSRPDRRGFIKGDPESGSYPVSLNDARQSNCRVLRVNARQKLDHVGVRAVAAIRGTDQGPRRVGVEAARPQLLDLSSASHLRDAAP
jgi:hypothetical protein